MELKIKDDNVTPKKNNVDNGMPDLGLGDMDATPSDKGGFGGYSDNPIKISTNIDYEAPKTKSSGFDVMTVVKLVAVIVIIGLVVKLIANLANPKVVDITDYINSDVDTVANALDIEMKPDAEMATQIHHYSNGTVTVEGNGEVGVVYIDGAYAGLHVDAKGYSMFGVTIGEPEYDAVEALSFDYDDSIVEVIIHEGITGIGEEAFYDCYNLESITILNLECSIYQSGNTIDSGAVIYGHENSTAQSYAEKYGRFPQGIGCC